MSKFGKGEDFVIEHLVFEGTSIIGYFTQGGSIVTLKGALLPPTKNEHSQYDASEKVNRDHKNMLLKLEGINSKTGAKYIFRGFFDNLELRGSLQDVPPRMVPRVLQLELKGRPCTVFLEPGKRLFQGQARVSTNHLFVMFLDKGRLHIISGIKNKAGVYVAYLIRGPHEYDVFHMVQTVNPLKVKHKPSAIALCEVNYAFGIVIEIVQDISVLTNPVPTPAPPK